jgi:CubicO group peptidase (beta-lactamase class C family)
MPLLFTLLLASTAVAPTPGSDISAAMKRLLASTYKANAPGAAVLVVRNGKVVLRGAYGMANLELRVPMRPDMVFRLGSVTKQFTAVAILMLVDERKLALEQDVRTVLPAWRGGGRKITIEQLLTHTSGVKDFLPILWPARMREDVRPAVLIETLNVQELEFEPGTKASYSNSNYILLGAVIEKISGMPYGRFLEERIFKPLGMAHSSYEEPQDLIANRASGYRKVEGRFLNAPYVSTVQLFAAGALTSSVDDLALWDAAAGSEKLLGRASWDRLFTPYKLADGTTAPYASGWVLGRLQGRLAASHAGGIPGFRSFVLRLPDEHVYVAVLSNDETAEAQPEYVGRRLAALAIGKTLEEEETVQLDGAALNAFTGAYRESAEETLTIRREGTHLFGQDTGNPQFELYPISADTFVVKAFDARVTFLRNAEGTVTGLVYRFGGEETRIEKVR